MTTVGVAEYDVLLSRSKIQAEVSAASAQIEAGMGASARKVESEFGSAAKTALKGFVAFEGFKFGKEAIDGAVSLAQQQQRANVEFGNGVKIVDEYAAHAAKGAGLSERSALQAASAFGTLFHGLGVGGRTSAQMSTTLVQLSADFAALHGTSQESAVQAITRGLGGMGRGLRQYGIFLTDANLKQEAVNLGLYKGSGALSQAAKTQAAYALIVKGGASANGAFADSSNSLLGKQKVLSAEWDNAKDKIGGDLVPAMKSAVTVGTGLLGVFDALPGPLREFVIGTGVASGVVKLFGGSLTGIAKAGAGWVAGLGAAEAEAATDADTLAASTLLTAKAIQTEQAEAIKLAGALAVVGESVGGLAGAQSADAVTAAGAADANAVASAALLAEQAAADRLVVALQALGLTEDEVSLATTGMTVAEAEAAAAAKALALSEGEADIASVGLLATLAPLIIAAGGMAVAYGLMGDSASRTKSNVDALEASIQGGDSPLDAFNKKLAATLSGTKGGFSLDISGKDFRSGIRDAQIGTEELSKALLGSQRDFQAFEDKIATEHPGDDYILYTLDQLRKSAHDAKGQAKDLATNMDALGISANGAGGQIRSSTDDITKWNQAVVDGAIAAVDKEHDIEAAIFAEQDSSVGLTQAIKDEATARRAAAGDSDEYRAALATIARDKLAEAKASRDVTQAEQDLTAAREQASRSLRDEVLDNQSAIISAERAKLALEDSKDALAKTQDDPRATARQKEQALLDEKDAEIALQQAQNKRGDSAADLAKAEADGVNGAPSVVAAKQQVADAIQAQGDAEKQTASDTKAAAKVISDAKDTERQASSKLRDAVIAEATAQENIAKLAYGAAAGHDAFNASLLRSVALLDPNSPLVKELNDYATMLEYLATVEAGTIGNFPGGPQGNSGTGQGELPSRPQGAPHAPGKAPDLAGKGSSGGLHASGGKIINIGTVNTHQGATAIEVANELAFGTH